MNVISVLVKNGKVVNIFIIYVIFYYLLRYILINIKLQLFRFLTKDSSTRCTVYCYNILILLRNNKLFVRNVYSINNKK